MALSPLQLDVGLTGPALTAGLPPIPPLRRKEEVAHETGRFQDLSQFVAKVRCRKSQPSSEEGRMPPEKLQNFVWQEFFSDPTQWWDKRRAWVESQLALRDAGIKRHPESVSTTVLGQRALAPHEAHLELEMSRELCVDGRTVDPVDVLHLLVLRGCHVPSTLLHRVLTRCIAHKDLVLGRRIHALAVESGYEGDAFLATHLIGLYASLGRLEEAMRVFSTVSTPDAYNWATIIFAYARHGDAAQALRLYGQMRLSSVAPDDRVYVAVLRACATAGDLVAGQQVHAHILASPGKPDEFVQRGLLAMYIKCGSLEDARKVFVRMPQRDVVTWNAMIAGYAQQGIGQEALRLYSTMQQEDLTSPNSVTFVCLLQACASIGVGALHQGRQLHAEIEERGLYDDVVLGGSLLTMYVKCCSAEDARKVFDRLPERDVVTWTAMIAGYAQQGMGQEALDLYHSMQQQDLSCPNSVTFVCLLQACASVGVGALHQGKQLHAQITGQGLQTDVVVGSSLVNMYTKCGSLEDARSVFDRLRYRNVVTWTAMIGAYAQHGMGQEALSLCSHMQQDGISPPNSVTFVCLLQACSSVGVGALRQGKQLHAQIEEQGLQDDVGVGCSLVDMYAKCGSLEEARRVFDRLSGRDVATWTAMIAGYVQQGMGQDALSLYSSLQEEGISPNSVTFLCLLEACAVAAGLPLGKQLHAQIEERGLQADVAVGAALVNMYAKCGSMSESQLVFDSLPGRSIEAWGALISGYARQGDSEVVFALLEKMRLEGIQPNDITFLSVLTLCSHVGLVDKGQKYFEIMRTDYGISPTEHHYTCMMDLLGRAGRLDEALQMAKTMPFPHNGAMWHTLLGACQKWNNIEIGQHAFESAVRLDEKDAASYVLMSNIYERAGMLEEANRMHARRVQCGAWKKPGQCWTDMGGVVHTFVVGDKNHVEREFINESIAGLHPISTLQHMQGPKPETARMETLSHVTGKVWYGKNQATCGEEGMPPEQLQDFLWQEFFSDPTQWRDNRQRKPTSRHPDFKHKKSKVALWLNNRHKPAWVDSQLATWDAGRKRIPESVSNSGQGHGAFAADELHLDIEMCSKLCENGRIIEAVDVLNVLVQRRCHVHNNLFYRVLKRCIANKDLILGRRIHALTIESGYEGDAFLATHLIGLYASHGRLEEAMGVFTKVSIPDAYVWATIIFACARHGAAAQAIQLYKQMCQSTVEPDNRIYVAVLKACATAGDLVAGKEVHVRLLASPGKPDMFVQTGLLAMYAKCGSLEDARKVFASLPERDVVTWNAMIAGYAQQGMGQEALNLFNSMHQEHLTSPNPVTFVSLLQACASVGVGALDQGRQLHAQIEEKGLHTDVVLGGSLLNMYVKCGSPVDARRVFDRLPKRDVVTWTTMIAGYAEEMGQEALNLYASMQQEGLSPPDTVTFVYLLQACASIGAGALHQGNELHAQIEKRGLQDDVVLGGSLVNMYVRCGSLEDARKVFDRLADRNVVTWTVMIAGYAQQRMGQQALSLYSSMQKEGHSCPDPVTFVCLLQACASVGVGALHQGKHLHAQIEEKGLQADVVLGSSLVNMYAKCGSIEEARTLFDRLPDRSVVTWTAMIAGYAQQGMGQEALSLYSSMEQEGLSPPDSVTVVCLLQACAIVACLPLGKQLHAQVLERGLQTDVCVGAALVNMYAKCGSMFDSQQVFDSLAERSIEAWSALISGYTRQGDGEVVFDLLDRMTLEGIQPNGITFLSVLTLCSHVGLVDKGRKCFEVMRTDYGITATVEHYTCMMDLLGRAGLLDEALEMAKAMPCAQNAAVWHSLLGACQKWNNVKIGEQAFEFAMKFDGKDAASYVLMSNIYARAGMWEEAKAAQARRVQCGAWKDPGLCWTDMGGVLHTFAAGDKKHFESEGICAKLKQCEAGAACPSPK